ncbi:MAG TPA: porin [Burkholderiaceae bacterium]
MNSNKKILVGALLAALSASATAQTAVTVGGLVDTYVGSVRLSGDAARRTVVTSGGMTTSWFGFNGQEDLGGGIKAEFALNGFFQADTGAAGRFAADNLFSRHAYVALSSNDMGRILVGRTSAPSFLPAVQFNPFGDSFQFSPLVQHSYVGTGAAGARNWAPTMAGDSGWSNLLMYSTPTVSGLQGNLYFQPGESSGSKQRNLAANAFYSNGPLGLTATYQSVRGSNPNAGLAILDSTASGAVNYASINEQSGYFVGARYDFTVVKAFATFRKNRNDAVSGRKMDDRTYSLGLSAPVSAAGMLLFAYADTERTGSLVGKDRSRDTASIGYDHKLSARTDLYAIYMSDKLSIAGRAGSFGFGARHRF